MDAIAAIKARLSIEDLVGSYCTLQKKGRHFIALCPFHNDSKPSLLVSPDKGIAYCFACQSGGDIFSFYQKIEGADFVQALKELAERTGVELDHHALQRGPKKDEKDRARQCLGAALLFYREQLKQSLPTLAYLRTRNVPEEQIAQFEIGLAPDSFSATYEYLLKQNFSRTEILQAGLGVQRELQQERIYDRFRNRLMFPIHDAQGHLVGFGGRTLASDDAKYVNSSDGPLFHKSSILYALHHAKEAIREKGKVMLVEGYFDVLACHRVGITNAVATCGTALTEQHAKTLKRYAETAVLCMDQDRAGQEAMERSFPILSTVEMHVEVVVLPGKDPSETLASDPKLLQTLLEAPVPYLDSMLRQLQLQDLSEPAARRDALHRVLRLLNALPFMVEREEYIRKAAAAFQTTETALQQDLLRVREQPRAPVVKQQPLSSAKAKELPNPFSTAEIVLGMFFFYPSLLHLLTEFIAPVDGFAKALFDSLRALPATQSITLDILALGIQDRERAAILWVYCEHHGFADWSQSMAVREIRKNCVAANREMLRAKQQDITRKMLLARSSGEKADEALLQNEYQEVLKLMKMAV